MLESNVFGLIGSPLLCVGMLIVFGFIASLITRGKNDYPIIDEMTDPTPAQRKQWEREDKEHNDRENEIGAWWNP